MNMGQAQSEWHEKSERTQRANEAALAAADPAQQAVDYEFARKAGIHLRHAAERKAWPRLAEYADLIDALAARLHAAEEALRELLEEIDVCDPIPPMESGDEPRPRDKARALLAAVQPGGDTEGET